MAEALDDADMLISAEVLAPSATTTTISRKDGDCRAAGAATSTRSVR